MNTPVDFILIIAISIFAFMAVTRPRFVGRQLRSLGTGLLGLIGRHGSRIGRSLWKRHWKLILAFALGMLAMMYLTGHQN